MNKRIIKRKSKTDWAKVKSMTDDEIDYSDIPEQGEDFFKNAVLVLPEPKSPVTIRLDKDILEWFKSNGSGYQTRINALLRAYMDAQKAK